MPNQKNAGQSIQSYNNDHDQSCKKDAIPDSFKKNNTKKTQKKSFHIDIFKDWCKGCGICAAFCPKSVLGLGKDGKSEVVNQDACIGCGWCEIRCPDFAISVKPEEKMNNGS